MYARQEPWSQISWKIPVLPPEFINGWAFELRYIFYLICFGGMKKTYHCLLSIYTVAPTEQFFPKRNHASCCVYSFFVVTVGLFVLGKKDCLDVYVDIKHRSHAKVSKLLPHLQPFSTDWSTSPQRSFIFCSMSLQSRALIKWKLLHCKRFWSSVKAFACI